MSEDFHNRFGSSMSTATYLRATRRRKPKPMAISDEKIEAAIKAIQSKSKMKGRS